MSQFKDFEGEFLPVKHYRPEELKSDQFLSRIKLQKRAPRAPTTSTPEAETKTKVPQGRPRIKLLGIQELKQRLETRNTAPSNDHLVKEREPFGLVGTEVNQDITRSQRTEEKQKMMKPQIQPTEKKRKISLAGTNEFRDLLRKKERLKELKRRNAILSEIAPTAQDTVIDARQESTPCISPEIQRNAGKTMSSESTSETSQLTQESTSETSELTQGSFTEIILLSDSDRLSPQIDISSNNESKSEGVLEDENVDMEAQEEVDNGKQLENSESENAPNKVNGASELDNLSRDGDFELGTEEMDQEMEDWTTFGEEDINLMRRTILSQLTGQSFPQIENSLLIGPYEQVYDILEHTVRDLEGHSTLLIGPRGSGKTLILNKAIESLKEKYSDLFMTIKLNASLHSDDKIALREIARQLDMNSNKFGTTSGETTTFEQRAISDTFTNILLTLDSNAPGREYDEEKEHPTPVIVIIDGIEKFTSNIKQTLLYNIFDLSQSSKIPIAVIGVSTMITTRELLEKRVRSRFSQRIIDITRAESMELFWNNAKLNFSVAPKCFSEFRNKEYPEQWNKYIELLNDRPSSLKKIIFKFFYATKNYKDVNTCGLLPVSQISCAQPFPRDEDFETYIQNMAPNYVQAAITSLSNLELLLVIAAARWIERVEVPHVNFNLAYKEYTEMMKMFNREATTLSSSASYIDNTVLASIKVSQKIWTPKVLRDCWANLYKMGLLFDVITTNNEVNGNNNYNMYKETVIEDSKMLQLDVSLEDLGSLIDSSVSFKKLTRL